MGQSLEVIAADLGVGEGTLRRYLVRSGGVRPRIVADSRARLSLEERFRIKELLVEKRSVRSIAAVLGPAPSTISREIRRGSVSGYRSEYRPMRAQRLAWEGRRRPKTLKIPSEPRLLTAVKAGLAERLSPEQIVGRLRRDFPDDPAMSVSHETIYRTLYLQARGGLKRDLQTSTRTGRTIRQPQRRAGHRRSQIKDMVSIWDRPVEALDRTVPGHWEGDLIVGKHGESAIGTIVERHSNFLILIHLDPAKENRVIATRDGLIAKLAGLPTTLKRSLTWDQGREMAQHRHISDMTGIDIYFADPRSPWQRASNENTNGLLRQYFPKRTDLSIHSQTDLDHVADQMNRRPRKRLEFATPYEVLSQYLLH
ncbi:IS30 family transposase [Naumannella halotolerans]|nr:IS30 family transposase [Naumannella halotolerans]